MHVKDTLYDKIYGTLKGTKYYGKCPDLLIGDQFYEIENFIGTIPKRAFSNMMNHGLKQSNNIIIKDCGLTENYMVSRIKGSIENGRNISFVWVEKNGKYKLLYQKPEGK